MNDPGALREDRIRVLKTWEAERQAPANGGGSNPAETPLREVNNHIHTVYSFSPYTPAMAALCSREAGLGAAGSVDHDSIAAAEEMIEACAVLGIGGCSGFEVRVSFKTGADGRPGPFADRKINNPDSEGIAYMTVQGVPGPAIPLAAEFLRPLREERLFRTRAMTENANVILREAGLEEIDFDRDIRGRSQFDRGGGITERHLLAALAEVFIKRYGKGSDLVSALEGKLGVKPPPGLVALLSKGENVHYLYDLLGILKSAFLPRIFIQPGEKECLPARQVTAFAARIGAIPAYAYLGDVGESPTGDKKAEHFEDEFLEPLFEELSRLGYRAVAYMPPRNTEEQLRRVQRLCAEWGFMEISGVDINSSRQSFNCPEVLLPPFRRLIDTTWALIAHERLSSLDKSLGLFAPDNPLAAESLAERLAVYARAGRNPDLCNKASFYTVINGIKKGR
ncbi:MAG: PHP domain-containing protein [Treponema sp.]|nr:PHP domain-containing protein [Treponema sp.]